MNSDFTIVSLKTNLKRGEIGEIYIKTFYRATLAS